MKQSPQPLILEIFSQGNILKMNLAEQPVFAQTLKQYGQCTVDPRDIQALCEELRLCLAKSSQNGFLQTDLLSGLKKSGRVLWDQLLTRTVKNRLKSSSDCDLILCLDEELIGIPWELLYDGEQFLSLRFNLGRMVRTRQETAVSYRSLQPRLKMLVIADPTGDLPSAYREGRDIRDRFDRLRRRLSIDFKSSSVDTMYIKKNLHEYDLVHFAGHCEYDQDDPAGAGWVFTDGRFSAADIQVIGQTQSLASLIFSNSCHSADMSLSISAGQQGNYSLASAFLFCGVRHYIGAVQRVQDEVGLMIARQFYDNVFKGNSIGRSLRLARLKTAERFGMGSLAWAHHLLYGDPGFVLFGREHAAQEGRIRSWKNAARERKRELAGACILLLAAAAIAFAAVRFLPTLHPTSFLRLRQAQAAFRTGENEEAIRISSELMQRDPDFLAAYPLLADTYARRGDRRTALNLYFSYAVKSQERNKSSDQAAAYVMIGWLYHQMGDYPKAYEFYCQARSTCMEYHDKLNEALVLRRLAVWYMDKGDDDQALQLLTKSSEINRERSSDSRYKYNLACDYFDLGLVFVNKDDYPQAKQFYAKSRALFETLRMYHETSDHYFNLGEVCVFEKQYQKALVYYLRGVAIDERQGNLVSLASDLTMIGELYSEMGMPDKAEEYFRKSLEVSTRIDARPERAAACFDLGLLYKQSGKISKARDMLRQAQEIYRNIDTPDQEQVKKELQGLDSSF